MGEHVHRGQARPHLPRVGNVAKHSGLGVDANNVMIMAWMNGLCPHLLCEPMSPPREVPTVSNTPRLVDLHPVVEKVQDLWPDVVSGRFASAHDKSPSRGVVAESVPHACEKPEKPGVCQI